MVHQSLLPSAQAASKPARLQPPPALRISHVTDSLATGQAPGARCHHIHLCHPPCNGRRISVCTFKRF